MARQSGPAPASEKTKLKDHDKNTKKHKKPRTLEVPGLVRDDDEADVVGVDVHRVVPGDGDADLELAREVAVPVQRLHLVWFGFGVGFGLVVRWGWVGLRLGSRKGGKGKAEACWVDKIG